MTGTRVVATRPGAIVVIVGGTRTAGSGGRVVVTSVVVAVVVSVAADDGLDGAADCAGVSLPPHPATSATADRTAHRIVQRSLGDRRRAFIDEFDGACPSFLPNSQSNVGLRPTFDCENGRSTSVG
jgi:hypothetical protein